MTLSGLTSWTNEWLGSPPSAWQGRKVWAGKTRGEFSRDTAESESRVVELDSGLRDQHQVWHGVLRCLQALYGLYIISTMQFHGYPFQQFPLLSTRGFSGKFSEHEIWLQLCSLPAAEFTPVLSRLELWEGAAL